MKALITSMVLASASAFAQQAPAEPTLKPGSEVNLEPLASAQWVQGEAPKSFEPGKIYVFECWATWCGPCVAAIPHVNELYKKYHDKGLNVFGMNVWEDGLDKVEKFVKTKGDGMSYPVAYTGKGSAFEKEWLIPAGVKGIPHAFVVKDGKLLLTTHPMQLTDSMVESLLSGDEGAKKVSEQLNAAKESREKSAKVLMEIRKAASTKDVATMEAKIAEFEKLDPNSPNLAAVRFDLLTAKEDWTAAAKSLSEMPDGSVKQMVVLSQAQKLVMGKKDENCPPDYMKAVSAALSGVVEKQSSMSNPYTLVMLSQVQWKADEKEAAKATVAKIPDSVSKLPANSKMPVEPFGRYAKALEEGNPPSMQEFSGWMRDATKSATGE